MNWFVYIVECSDTSLYTGISNAVARRVLQHNTKKGAKSLLGKLPVKLVYTEKRLNKIDAAKREYEIKGWSRDKKKRLIEGSKGFTLNEQNDEGFYPKRIEYRGVYPEEQSDEGPLAQLAEQLPLKE